MTGLAFFVYKRPEYTQKVIEGINRNGFEKVYIFQDGLKNEEDRPLWEKVSELIRGIDFTETEIHISDFNRGLAESIIYGMNYVGETLLSELANTNIQVKYAIDKNADNIYADVDILSPEDDFDNVDVVIVTPITFFDEIEETLSEKLDCPIISMEDILYES